MSLRTNLVVLLLTGLSASCLGPVSESQPDDGGPMPEGSSGGSTGGGTTGGSTTSGTSTGSTSGGGTTGGATSGGSTSSGYSTGGTGTSSGGSGGCTLHPPPGKGLEGTLFCPNGKWGGKTGVYCDPSTQHCCEGLLSCDPSGCEKLSATCLGWVTIDWHCADPVADCPSGMDCCAPGATLVLGGSDDGGMLCKNTAQTFKKTKCVPRGTCTGILMCTADSECPGNGYGTMTCTPFTSGGTHVGGCL